MRVQVKGGGKVDLTKNEFVASGGEGEVYVKNGVAYKIYNDPSRMIPSAKIKELSVLTRPNIINPQSVILNSKNTPVGYTMRALDQTEALCRLFTKAFRNRNNVSPEQIFKLVQKFQDDVAFVHSKGILIVDMNEMNFLVNKSFDELFFIDVDSYQTPNFPATALMESIRDRHAKKGQFNIGTDWFAWSIVTFQMFVGIHPYKGKHNKLTNLDDRMLKNVSVLNKDVTMPKVCYPLSVIPQNYLDYYKAVFENGFRGNPPSGAVGTIQIVTHVDHFTGSNNFVFDLIEELDAAITLVTYVNGRRIVQTGDKVYIDGKEKIKSGGWIIGETPRQGHVTLARIKGGNVELFNATTNKPIKHSIYAESLMTYEGRIYSKQGGIVSELQMVELPTQTQATVKTVANVLPKASKMYDGVIFQNMLGAYYVSIFPNPGQHYQIRIKELEEHKIVDAKFSKGVLQVIGVKKGKYDRFMFRFDNEYKLYDWRFYHNVPLMNLNFVVLDNGVMVQINEDEEIVLMRSKKDDSQETVVKDPGISGGMMLYNHGIQSLVADGKKLLKINMKQKK